MEKFGESHLLILGREANPCLSTSKTGIHRSKRFMLGCSLSNEKSQAITSVDGVGAYRGITIQQITFKLYRSMIKPVLDDWTLIKRSGCNAACSLYVNST